jgi:TonB family protein
VLVHGRRDLRGALAGFYGRMERGQGRFFTAEAIEQSNARRMSDLLRGIPGLRIDQRRFGTQTYRMRGSNVAPLVWLDGVPMGAAEVDLDNFDPRTFAGIEIYSGPATVPIEFTGGRAMTTSGGTILLWSREGEFAARRARRGEPSPAARIAEMVERRQAFTSQQVDAPARPLGPGEVVPVYPDSLYEARIGGYVEVEFVVDASGRPRMETFGVVLATHERLGAAVRRAIEERRYSPAIMGGRAVAQVVHQPFTFIPDSATPRRPER